MPIVKDMKIVGECRYHVVNVYEHSINALRRIRRNIREGEFF